jgi:hypothetical protein
MRSLSAAELIRMWERGMSQSPVDRALTVLTAVSAESPAELAILCVGRRDARLVQVYEHIFGRMCAAFAECSRCHERLEYSISTTDLAGRTTEQLDESAVMLEIGEISLQLRPPNTLDLSAVSKCDELSSARRVLAERCIVEARRGETPLDAYTLTDAAVEQVAQCLAKVDPQADILVDLTCPACGHVWQLIFDIESFLWTKVSALAKRLLREVHVLAEAYGWAERDILALTAVRRQFYLEMVG